MGYRIQKIYVGTHQVRPTQQATLNLNNNSENLTKVESISELEKTEKKVDLEEKIESES